MRTVLAAACMALAALQPACTTGAGGVPDKTAEASTARPAAKIRTREELERHLREDPRNPIRTLSPLARKRFIESLAFGPQGADPYRYDRLDLTAELTASQIRDVLGVFGIEPDDYLLSLARSTPKPPSQLIEEATPSAIAKAYDGYYRARAAAEPLPERERREAIERAYARDFAAATPGSLHAMAAGDFGLLYQATYTTAFYSGRPQYASRLAELLDELEARGLAQQKFYSNVYESLIAARGFAQAEKLRSGHPAGLEALPQLVDALPAGQRTATAWIVDPERRRIERRSIAIASGAEIVVIAHPLCHFSQDASRAIAADPILAPLFKRSARWLTPPLTSKDFDVVQSWNRDHPDMAMAIAYDRDEWPQFDLWATPVFYFLRNGKLVAAVEGWRGDGSRAEVLAASRRAGLLPDSGGR